MHACQLTANILALAFKNLLQDERSSGEKAIDDWLPITSSRNAKWWYSAFHNVTAMVGAGVLSLPYAMSKLGWYVCHCHLPAPATTIIVHCICVRHAHSSQRLIHVLFSVIFLFPQSAGDLASWC